jgi:hypothetical protein
LVRRLAQLQVLQVRAPQSVLQADFFSDRRQAPAQVRLRDTKRSVDTIWHISSACIPEAIQFLEL